MSDLDTIKLKVDVQRRLIKMLSRRRIDQTVAAAHLLAHQQARGILYAAMLVDRVRTHHDDAARLRRGNTTLRAENERLRGVLRGIRDITHCQGYDSDNDLWDEEPSPCACVNCEARAALGEEVREHERREKAEREGRA